MMSMKVISASLRKVGVNRISIGLQSWNDKRLRYLGRRHDAAQSAVALEAGYSRRLCQCLG